MSFNIVIRVKVGDQGSKPGAEFGERIALLIGKFPGILSEIAFDFDAPPLPIVKIRSGVSAPDDLAIGCRVQRSHTAFHDDSAAADREMLTNIGPSSLKHVAALDAPGKLEGCRLFHVADKRARFSSWV